MCTNERDLSRTVRSQGAEIKNVVLTRSVY